MTRGRKSLKDELGIIRRYSDLSEPYFKFIRKMLDGRKKDKMWAAEQLRNAYVRMLPLEITGKDGSPLIIRIVHYSPENKMSVPAQAQ